MKKLFLAVLLILFLAFPVNAADAAAPPVPDSGEELMPAQTESFAQGLWEVIRNAIQYTQPQLHSAAGVCGCLLASVLLASVLRTIPGSAEKMVEFVTVITISVILLSRADAMIALGGETVRQLSEYGKLLLPVLAAAVASQGGVSTSAALYAGTAAFDAVLSALIANILIPMVYGYLVLSIGAHATGQELLNRLKDQLKGIAVWCLKTVLYVFTGYMAVTGVVSGSTDATTMKATKLTISGMVPVVGGILSDASEAVLVGAQLTKNAVGIYGLLAVISVWIAPFLQIGVQYLLLKLTGTLCEAFGMKKATGVIRDFTTAMGLLLGMTASVCILLLVSTVCFMRGVA